jgi:hypothetical protein
MFNDLKSLLKKEGFVIIAVTLLASLLVYLLVKSPSIKTTTEIQLDGTEVLDSIIISDTLSVDTIPFRVQE